jgi:hypothetical protein
MAVHQTGFEGSAVQPQVSYLAAFELTYSIYAPPQLTLYTWTLINLVVYLYLKSATTRTIRHLRLYLQPTLLCRTSR